MIEDTHFTIGVGSITRIEPVQDAAGLRESGFAPQA
jgi:hypothetical protein